MIRRTTWVFLFIFVLLATVAWYLEFSPNHPELAQSTTPTPTTAPKLLEKFQETQIVKIEFKTGWGESFSLGINPDTTWVFNATPYKPVDQNHVAELLSYLAAVQPLNVLDTSTSPASLGLTSPQVILFVTDKSGQHAAVKIGDPTPTGSGYYVQLDRNPIVIIDKDSIDRMIALSSAQALTISTPTPAVTASSSQPAGASTAVPTP